MSVPFYKLIVIGENEYGFWNEPLICVSLDRAYHLGNHACQSEEVYGYVIVKVEHETWTVVSESVYGCDYTVYEHNGIIKVKKGTDRIVMV